MASLRKRGNTWYVQYKVNGKWKRDSCKTSVKKIAQEVLTKYRVIEAEGIHDLPSKQRVTLGEFLKKYLQHIEATLAPRWFKNKELLFNGYLVPFFGENTALRDITADRIESYRRMRLKKVSARTVNIDTHHCLLPMLKQAVEWKVLDIRRLPIIKKLKDTTKRLRFLSEEEIKALLDAAALVGTDMDAYVRLMLYAGLRAGEALALRWKDVDFERENLTIAPRDGWTTKSGTGRNVPMPEDLTSFLRGRWQKYPDSESVVAASGDYTPHRIKRLFQRTVEQAGLQTDGEDKVTAHTLRHTYASHLVMNSTPLYTVTALLGHSDSKTTQIYAHLAPGHLKDVVGKIRY